MGTAERREREKEQRRQSIIDAAEKVIFSKGYENATMDEVASEAELSKGTLYLYFKSKEALYFAIVLRAMKMIHTMVEEDLVNCKSGLEKIRTIGFSYIKFGEKYPDYFNALLFYESMEINFDEIKSNYDYQDDITIAAFHESDKTIEKLSSALEEGIEDGSIRKDLDPHKTAIILWGTSTGMMQLLSMKGHCITKFHNNDPHIYMQYYMDFMRDSLLPK